MTICVKDDILIYVKGVKEMKRINFDLHDEKYKKIKIAVIRDGYKSIKDFFHKLIDNYFLEKKGRQFLPGR